MNQDPVLVALGKIARIVAGTLELKEVIERVAEAAAQVLPMDRMVLARLEEGGALTLYSRTGGRTASPLPVSLEDFSPRIRPRLDGILRLDDLRAVADPAYSIDREVASEGVRSVLTAPLQRGDQPIGFMIVSSRRPRAFAPEMEAVLRSMADLLSLALEHERLWSLDGVRRRRLDALDALLPVVANALDVKEIFSQISEVVKPVLPHDQLFLVSANADQTLARLEAFSGDILGVIPATGPLDERRRFPAGQEYHLIRDLEGDFPGNLRDDPVAKILGVRSVLRIPIYLEGIPDSTLNFLSRMPNQYSEDDVPVARRVADHVSLALSHRLLAEEEQRAARLEQRVHALSEQLETTLGTRQVVGRSKKWKAVLAQVAKVAQTETTVLLTGESGTGKEVLARLIHRGSPRARGPFVAINCAALPESLLESEIFGHERGAFTGAVGTRLGCIEQASGGLLFLDEVGEMSPAVQAKLLRVLEQREFTRVGGARPIRANVRLVAATNRALVAAIAQGTFREDLYYRLRVFEITAPPLRERTEDIFPMAEAFLEEIGRAVARPAGGISRQAHDALLAYPWPGNARELRNVLERATILCDGGLITLDHLPPEVAGRGAEVKPGSATFPGFHLETVERELIYKALEQAENNRSRAAKLLGITRPTLYYKLRKFGISRG
jgi:transcriptional regulator with GAF, ATPase, and Fis domain